MLPRPLPEGPWRSSGELGDGWQNRRLVDRALDEELEEGVDVFSGMVALICLRAASFESGSNARSRPMASLRTGDLTAAGHVPYLGHPQRASELLSRFVRSESNG
jgi:hypothetical protein